MTVDLGAVDGVLAALADPMRRQVLVRLAAPRGGHGHCAVRGAAGEPAGCRAAPAVLDWVGLVAGHRAGRERRYTVQPEQLTAAPAE